MKAFKIPLLHHYYLSGPLLEALTTLTRLTQDILHPCTFCPLAQELQSSSGPGASILAWAMLQVYLCTALTCWLDFPDWSWTWLVSLFSDDHWTLNGTCPHHTPVLLTLFGYCALLVRTVLCLCYDYAQLPAFLPSQSSSILTALWYTVQKEVSLGI